MPVIAYYDSNSTAFGRLYVDPPPNPTPPPPFEEKGKYGVYVYGTGEDGDEVIPAYSANLKEINAISSFTNIAPREAGDDGTENIAIQHMQLTSHPILVRQLISDTTGIDVANNVQFWDKAPPGLPNPKQQ